MNRHVSVVFCFRLLAAVIVLQGCAAPDLYYWGEYEDSLYERYVDNSGQHSEAYLRNLLMQAQQHQQKVPPGIYADYGFLLYLRGDKNSAITYFQKEKEQYPESVALMNKLIEKIRQQTDQAEATPETQKSSVFEENRP